MMLSIKPGGFTYIVFVFFWLGWAAWKVSGRQLDLPRNPLTMAFLRKSSRAFTCKANDEDLEFALRFLFHAAL